MNPSVTLLSMTENPDLTVAIAARLCYSNKTIEELKQELSEDVEKQRKIIQRVVNDGHHSPLEHASFTFGIENMTRACLAQITRHRLAAFSVRSQRYCDMGGFSSKELYYPKNVDKEIETLYDEVYNQAISGYKTLVASGEAKEEARMVLPNGFPTSMVMSMNAREIRHVLGLRMCVHAQREIREIATQMRDLVVEKAPIIFENLGANCQQLGYCPEKSRGCGKYPTITQLLGSA